MMIPRCLYLCLLLQAPLFAADIVLSPNGPHRTVEEARDAARKAEKPVRIVIEKGRYEIPQGIKLGTEDSGVSWEAAKGATVQFSGGKVITGWQPTGDGLWKAEVPEVKDGKWYFQQLWVNGRRAVRARTPNKGFLHMKGQGTAEMFPPEKEGDTDWIASLKNLSFTTNPETFALFAAVKPEELNDVTLIIPHTWDVHHYRVRQLNKAAGAVLLRGPRIRELLTYEPDGRFYMENLRQALDEPGEWFLSRQGELYYKPLPGEKLGEVEIVAPVADRLLSVGKARDISFKGIQFLHQQWLMGPEGYGISQAANNIGAALEIDGSSNIQFEQCTIAHIGGYGVWFRLSTVHSGIRHSHVHDLGGGAVRIGPTGQIDTAAPETVTSFITVDNNILQQGGRIFPDAVAVFIGHSADNVVSHNDIGDFYYTGISAGWHWGYGESISQRNRLENNHIHHLGWGFTSDMGGFYGLGAAFGTVVRGNHIHHVSSYRYGGWGLYTDEGSSGVLMENNLVHDTSESSFHQHYGYYNAVRNNIFAFGKKAQLQRSRPEARTSFIIERNILVWDPATSKFLDGTQYNWNYTPDDKKVKGEPARSYVLRRNMYWPLSGKMPEPIAQHWTWEDWRKSGRDHGSVVKDPKFVDISKRDFRFQPDSPYAEIGFQPWDLNVAGVRTDGPEGAAWRDKARQGMDFPNWEKDSIPWPSPEFEISMETFEYQALGKVSLPRQTVRVEDKGDSIGVTEEAASPIPLAGAAAGAVSKRSLKFQDAPDLTNAYDPHYVIKAPYTDGTLHWSFDLMYQEGADGYAEMRDDQGAAYKVGPCLQWKGGKVRASHKSRSTPVMDLAPGQWLRLEVTAKLGSRVWSLTATRQDGEKVTLHDLPCDPEWVTCGNILWSSLATTKTAMFIDNLSLKRKNP